MRIKKIKLVLGIVIFICIFCIGIYYLVLRNEISIQQVIGKTKVKDIYPCNTTYFSDFGSSDFTCTGFTFDEKEDCFWIVDNGHLKTGIEEEPRLVKVDRNLTQKENKIYLGEILGERSDVQGIAYDSKSDTFWITSRQWIYNIDKYANLKKKIKVFCYPFGFVNSIAYDRYTDSIWVLTSKNGLFNYSKEGKVIKSHNFNIEQQDHIFLVNENLLLITFGANYCSNENYLVEVNLENGKLGQVYSLNESYAMEGIYVLGKDLYVVNDGLYHDAQIKKSYINIYEFY